MDTSWYCLYSLRSSIQQDPLRKPREKEDDRLKWTDGWQEGWMDEQKDGWTDGQMDRQTEPYTQHWNISSQ